MLAVPTPDHCPPLLHVIGTQTPSGPGSFQVEGVDGGSSQQRRRRLWQGTRACLDFAILGRFNEAQPSNLPLRTSRNQVLRLFSNRYAPADFSEELIEISIHEGGRAEVTGFPTLGLPW
jgi:hypothetical protein